MSSGEANRSWSLARWALIAILSIGLAVVYFAPIGGQSEAQTAPRTENEKLARLRERAEGFWKARVESDWDKTYEFHFPPSPEKEDERTSRLQWKQGKGNILYHRFQVDGVELVSEDEGTVTVTYQWEMVNPMFRGKLGKRWLEDAEGVKHPWHFKQGDWYRDVQSLADRIQAGGVNERARKLAPPPEPKQPRDQNQPK